MTPDELASLTLAGAKRRFEDGSLTAADLAEAELARIADREAEVGAFLSVDAETAMRAAEAADERRASGTSLGPLDGMPVAIKDNLLVAGMPATAASRMLEGYVATYDATAVAKLKAAGAVILGKANLDEFAMGASTESSALGVTRNPWDLTRVPGGSSGGSAAAVADSQALFALGTDTGGSIRQPAAFCGIAGFKPTYGAVSRSGAIALASSLDQVGPMAKTVEDVAAVLAVIAGRDPLDATSDRHADLIAGQLADIAPMTPLRIGVPKEYLEGELAPEVAAGFEEASERMRSLGHEIVPVSLPHADLGIACYYILMPAEASSNLARYDGIRYPAPGGIEGSLEERYRIARGEGFGPETKRRIILGTFVLSSGYYDAYYGKALAARRLITADFERALENVDVVMAPTTPTTAFGFGAKADPVSMYLADVFTVAANIAGIPALSVPVSPWGTAYGPEAMPVGFQLMGRRFDDARVLQLGMQYERAA